MDSVNKRTVTGKTMNGIDRWEVMFDFMPDLISIHDKDFSIIKANKAFSRAVGLPLEQIIGKKCYELIHTNTKLWSHCPHHQAVQKNARSSDQSFETSLKMHLQGICSPIFNEQNEFIGTVQIARNISKQEQENKEMREIQEKRFFASEGRFKKLFAEALEYCYMVSTDGLMQDINNSALEALGYQKEELIGRPVKILYAPESQKRQDELFKKWEKGHEIKNEEMIVITKTGKRKVILLSATMVKNDEGQIQHSIYMQVDITELRRIRDVLHNEKILADTVWDSVPGLLYLCTQEKKLIRWNKQHEKITGYTAMELHNFYVNDWFDENEFDMLDRVWETVFFGEGQVEVNMHLKHKDGTKRPFFFICVKVDVNREPHLVGIGIDLTEQKKTEHETITLRDELAYIARHTLMGEFSSALSHEINQPLAAILSNAQAAKRFLAKDSVDLDEIQGILGDIIQDSTRAGNIITRLRALVGKTELKMKVINIKKSIQEVIDFLKNYLTLNNVSISFQCRDSIPKLKGDKIQFQQVILNLIHNSCEAMEKVKEREINILVKESGQDKILISLQDFGTGFPAESKESLFKPFYTTKKTGMGMGLALSRRIIGAHNGRIWIENCKKGGAAVFIELPAEEEHLEKS